MDAIQTLDGHFSPDGHSLAVTDVAGQLHIYGLGGRDGLRCGAASLCLLCVLVYCRQRAHPICSPPTSMLALHAYNLTCVIEQAGALRPVLPAGAGPAAAGAAGAPGRRCAAAAAAAPRHVRRAPSPSPACCTSFMSQNAHGSARCKAHGPWQGLLQSSREHQSQLLELCIQSRNPIFSQQLTAECHCFTCHKCQTCNYALQGPAVRLVGGPVPGAVPDGVPDGAHGGALAARLPLGQAAGHPPEPADHQRCCVAGAGEPLAVPCRAVLSEG